MFKKGVFLIFASLLVVAGVFWFRLFSPENSWICENDTWIKHGNPSSPKPTSLCGNSSQNKTSEPAFIPTTTTDELTKPSTSTTNIIPGPITLSGLYVCLPSRNDGPQTLECALGILADDGIYYSLDTNRLGTYIESPTGSRLHLEGFFTPIEMISSNLGRLYNVKGVISVVKVEEVD